MSLSKSPLVTGPSLLAILLSAACSSTAAVNEEHRGSEGLGDPYYPGAGNGGYDVQHYDVDLLVDVASGELEGRATLRSVATQELASFHLDLHELEVTDVEINGKDVDFMHGAGELTIEIGDVLDPGAEFEVMVEYRGVPQPVPDPAVKPLAMPGNGWLRMDSGSYVFSECVGAAGWLPCNNHPSDKATYSFRVTVPTPYTVAANGLLTGLETHGDLRSFSFEMRQPMATYLATVNIAEFELSVEEGPGGIPLYHYYPVDASALELLPFARTTEMMEHFIDCFGPYPFDSFGGVLTAEDFNAALETQALPIYSRNNHEDVVAHELAHMWFGDSVTPSEWKDIWLNEGFAVYAGWLWREHMTGEEGRLLRSKATYLMSLNFETEAPYDPGVELIFGDGVYARGALVLDALRRELGDALFFVILKSWAQTYAGQSASTQDFIDLCEAEAGRDLSPLFDAWLYAAVVPEVPEYLEGEE